METYTAVFERDDRGMWLVELAEEPHVRSYGRSLATARASIRDATARQLGADPHTFELLEDVRLPRAMRATVERARRQRDRARTAQESAVATTREAARSLVDGGHLTLRDAAQVLGMSHQRVQQLLAREVTTEVTG